MKNDLGKKNWEMKYDPDELGSHLLVSLTHAAASPWLWTAEQLSALRTSWAVFDGISVWHQRNTSARVVHSRVCLPGCVQWHRLYAFLFATWTIEKRICNWADCIRVSAAETKLSKIPLSLLYSTVRVLLSFASVAAFLNDNWSSHLAVVKLECAITRVGEVFVYAELLWILPFLLFVSKQQCTKHSARIFSFVAEVNCHHWSMTLQVGHIRQC